MKAEVLIENADMLRQYFFEIRSDEKMLKKGIFVSTKIRRDVLLAREQAKIILEGRVYTIKFENCYGGVWRAYIDDID